MNTRYMNRKSAMNHNCVSKEVVVTVREDLVRDTQSGFMLPEYHIEVQSLFEVVATFGQDTLDGAIACADLLLDIYWLGKQDDLLAH